MFSWLMTVQPFMPHGMCLLWRPGLVALHVASDSIIALSYFAIPVAIFVFVARRGDLDWQHKALALLFAVFISACGLTHVMSILVLWQPYYDAEGLLKAVTAVVSLATALALPFLIPQLLAIPSPRRLAAEIASHKATLAELGEARGQLARRVQMAEDDLKETTRRFELALKDSPVTVFEQDANLRYTWIYNPPMDLNPDTLIGRTEADIFDSEGVDRMRALKRQALASNSPQRGEISVSRDGKTLWFDIRVEPMVRRDGERGLIATAADITAFKRQQDHQQLLMRELNHRSKNLLTIVLSIVRQTGRVYPDPRAFMDRVQERLGSLARAHDVLAQQNWGGADLRAIVESQLLHQLQTYGERLSIKGEPCTLPPQAAHYVAMAIHELGSNAVKYGALAGEAGAVVVDWTLSPEGETTRLSLTWTETGAGGAATPTRQGFGSRILKTLAPGALDGEAMLEFGAAGFRWALTGRLQAGLGQPV